MGSQNNNVQQDKQCTVSKQNQPWLDERGNPLSDEQLKTVAKEWDQNKWDAYLHWFEKPLSESQLHPIEYDRRAEKMEFNCFEFAQSCADDELKRKIQALMKDLPPNQRKIIELVFWGSLSERQIAFDLKISRSTVKKAKKRVLAKLAASFRGMPPTSPIMRGKISSLSKNTGEPNDKNVLELAKGEVPWAS